MRTSNNTNSEVEENTVDYDSFIKSQRTCMQLIFAVDSSFKASTYQAKSTFRPNLATLPWRQPGGRSMVCLVNFQENATSKRLHLWEIDSRFALNSTPGWLPVDVRGVQSVSVLVCECVSV